MEDEEDDFYTSNAQDQQYEHGAQQAHERDGKMDLSDNQDEDEEEDSDDVRIKPREVLQGSCIDNGYIGCPIHVREARRRQIRTGVGYCRSLSFTFNSDHVKGHVAHNKAAGRLTRSKGLIRH